ncbi:MAG: Rpn family recombination-promoting nuclease/putative transposase [Candidatus Lariskella arthropodorum]
MTNKKVSHNPHDRFFKEAMSHKRTAKEFFETYIPKNTLDRIDLESIKHEKESFIDKDLGDGVVDALFSVALKNGEPGYLYILVEQQTGQERFMALRLWKYILRIIERHIKHRPKDKMLPYVLPIVLYTGTCAYRVANNFFDLFHSPEFARELLTGEFKVVELNKISDDDLKKRLYSGVMQLMLKNIRLPDILPFLEGISGLIQMLGDESFVYIKDVIWYTLERGESTKSKEVIELFSKLFEERKEEVMTIADQLREQGKMQGIEIGIQRGLEKGIEKGMEKGRLEGIEKGRLAEREAVAKNLLLQGLDISIIESATGLSRKDLAKLQKSIRTGSIALIV